MELRIVGQPVNSCVSSAVGTCLEPLVFCCLVLAKFSTMSSARTRENCVNSCVSKVTVVLGAQWGDEGKGKVVDMLATDADIVCRCQVCHCHSRCTSTCYYLPS